MHSFNTFPTKNSESLSAFMSVEADVISTVALYATVLRLSVIVCLSSDCTESIVAKRRKRCVLEQKLLLTAYSNS